MTRQHPEVIRFAPRLCCFARNARACFLSESSRRGAASRCWSYNCQLALLRSGGCVFERGENILAF